MTSKTTRLLFSAALLVSAVTVRAGTINVLNMPPGETSLQLVTVGDPGNVADPDTGYGAVGYVYQMGEYDVTIGQYTAFLKAVAVNGDPYGLYNPKMASDSIGIVQTSTSAGYSYSVKGSGNMPVVDVAWGDAARFVNWLANGQPTGSEGANTTETGTYTLSGATSNMALIQVSRNPGSTWVLPTVDEWYKAAYYVGGAVNAGYWAYPTQSNTPPSNVLSATGTNNANFYDDGFTAPTTGLTPVGAFAASPSAYGSYDMGGNVWQWNETNYFNYARGLRGGSFADVASALLSGAEDNIAPVGYDPNVGFRVAYVPEPTSLALLLAGVVALGIWRLRRNAWGS